MSPLGLITELVKLFTKLPAPVKPIIVDVVRAVVNAPNPQSAALRALEESSRVEAFDQAMLHRK